MESSQFVSSLAYTGANKIAIMENNNQTYPEEGVNSNFNTLKDKQPKKNKSEKKSSRNKTRSQNFREKAGNAARADLQKELDRPLFFGFAIDINAPTVQMVQVVDQAKVLPISTRGIGFYSQSLFIKLHQTLKNIPQCSVYELYRLSLAQLELKLIKSVRSQSQPYPTNNDQYYKPMLDLEFRESIEGMSVNFGPIAAIINAIGSFVYGETTYYPRLPVMEELIPQPQLIVLSNLRRVVNLLSNRATPHNSRLYFYNVSPLPGAIWGPDPIRRAGQRRRVDDQHHPDFPLLMNPEDFMPQEYDIQDLDQDINRVKNFINFCSRKSIKYVENGSAISYDSKAAGLKTMLVTNYIHELRNPEAVMDREGHINYAEMSLPVGGLCQYWSDVKIDNITAFLGALHVLGEIPVHQAPFETYGVRALEHCRCRYDHRWVSMKQK